MGILRFLLLCVLGQFARAQIDLPQLPNVNLRRPGKVIHNHNYVYIPKYESVFGPRPRPRPARTTRKPVLPNINFERLIPKIVLPKGIRSDYVEPSYDDGDLWESDFDLELPKEIGSDYVDPSYELNYDEGPWKSEFDYGYNDIEM